jgi:hypothetical protein
LHRVGALLTFRAGLIALVFFLAALAVFVGLFEARGIAARLT